MFEDSLVESSGRLRMRNQRYAFGSLFAQSLLLGALAVAPLLHPAALPRRTWSMVLAPPQPTLLVAQPTTTRSATNSLLSVANSLIAPVTIHRLTPAMGDTSANMDPPASALISSPGATLSGLPAVVAGPPRPAVVQAAKRSGPQRISSGVALGQLIRPIQPVYPAIARAARVEGTVILQAVINAKGSIEDARVVSGPELLRSAALDAVEAARYRPFLLNGQAVRVETTVSVVFRLQP